jgi:peptidoglycan/LPS O-acetylase OafA/YrhL
MERIQYPKAKGDMKVLEGILKRDNNNFDLIRLIAALMVVYFHTFYLFKDSSHYDHGSFLLKGDSIGGLAVYIFFFLSGMFITSSYINLKNSYAFIIMRIFRIWPALIVCIIFTVFAAGPLVSKYSINAYFTSKDTWGYLIHDISLYRVKYTLPGVFDANHYPSAVNGSIWTLPLEILCYLMVLLIGMSQAFKNKIAAVLIYSLVIALYIINFHSMRDYLKVPFPFFVAGSLFYMFRKYIPVDYRIWIALIVIYAVFFKLILLYVLLVYSVLVLGSSAIFKKVKLPGDYSYGIYIYAFLVQQLVANYLPEISPYKSLLLTVPLTVLLAVLSWHFIEKPFIQIAKRITKEKIQLQTAALPLSS